MSKTPWLLRAEIFIESLRERIVVLDLPADVESKLRNRVTDAWDLLQDNPIMYGDISKRDIENVAQCVAILEEKKGIKLSKKEKKKRKFGFEDFFRKDSESGIVNTEGKPIHSVVNGTVYETPTTTSEVTYDTPSLNVVKPDEFLISVASGKSESDNNFEVYIKQEVYHRVMAFTKLLDDEITALLEVEREGQKFIIKGLQMFRQKVSKAQCEKEDVESIVEMYKRMIEQGKNPSELKCWWHSHNSMGVSPSGTDYDTIKEYGVDYAIMLITNHRKDVHCEVHIFKPFPIKFKNVPVYVLQPGISQEVIDECEKDIATYVRNERRVYTTHYPVTEKKYEDRPISEASKLIEELPAKEALQPGMSGYGLGNTSPVAGYHGDWQGGEGYDITIGGEG